jgi:hypothetical protein
MVRGNNGAGIVAAAREDETGPIFSIRVVRKSYLLNFD